MIDFARIRAEEMKLLLSVKGCTVMDKIKNEETKKELGIISIKGKNTKS